LIGPDAWVISVIGVGVKCVVGFGKWLGLD
jgi:hypothetical protein